MVAPGHLVVGANGNQCEVKREEEFNADGCKVGPSCGNRETAWSCAISGLFVGNIDSRNSGTNALGKESSWRSRRAGACYLPFFSNLSGGQNAGVDTCDQEGCQ